MSAFMARRLGRNDRSSRLGEEAVSAAFGNFARELPAAS